MEISFYFVISVTFIYLFALSKMNTTSFQTNQYNHLQQTQIHGQSGLKILAGEDLTYGDRKRIQQMQSDAWWKQQMEQKERKNNNTKMEKTAFDEQTLQIYQHRKQLEQQKAARLREMQIAYKHKNLQQLDQKINKDRLNRQLDTQERLNHINYVTNNDFYTQNPDTCKSYLGKNRYLPYHWKGMSEQQRQRILEQQAKQVQQKNLQKQIQKQEDRLFAEQMQAQRKALILADRAKNKGLKNVRKGMDEYNRLKAEEMVKKAYQAFDGVQTYKNE